MSAQHEVVNRLHDSLLNPLLGLAKTRSLAQLACSHRLQRTLDVQAQSLALAGRLIQALRQEQDEQNVVDDARRRYIGKLQQVTSVTHYFTTVNRGYFENGGNFGHPLTEHCGVTVTIGGWPKLPLLAKVTPVYGYQFLERVSPP